MGGFLLIGTAIGALVGLLHAVHVFAGRMKHGRGGLVIAGWFAFCTMALWTLLGAYVLAFWILGLAAMSLSRLRPSRRAA